MDKEEEKLLKKILPNRYESADAYNIRLNGSGVLRKVNEYINIESREDGQGINVYVKDNTSNGVVDIPVLVTIFCNSPFVIMYLLAISFVDTSKSFVVPEYVNKNTESTLSLFR